MALALSSRRSWIGAVVSVLAAVAVAAAVAGRSCRVSQPGPEVAVRDMLQAAKTGDRDAVFELLAPTTRARLEAEAKRSTDYVGAAIRFSAKDLVSIANTDATAPPADITVIEERGDHAVVLIVYSPAARSLLDLVRVDGQWRIEIPQYGTVD